MTSLFGKVSLIAALIFATLQSVLPLVGHFRKNKYLSAVARPATFGQFVFVVIAYALLTFAFAQSDFSIRYVAENSHQLLPLMYRLTAVWGAHEGSILLWVLILSSWSAILAIHQRNNATISLMLSVIGWISLCFLSFLIFTSNPFTTIDYPVKGLDLNPLLQDPGFVIHPPILYIGYVGFAVSFAITEASLLSGKLNQTWARLTRQYAVAAWCFLTFGITLGSWWAYRVLGWGGFWFWDPVENASLLPWICGLGLIHVLIICEKRGILKGWAASLALMTFMLSVLGTFLVRSGVLVSAHTFASDPKRGIFLLLMLALLSLIAFVTYCVCLPGARQKTTLNLYSRETFLLANSVLLFVAMIVVLLGTLYPLIIDALHLGALSVGAPYFNMVMQPIIYLFLLLMAVAPLFKWKQQAIKPIMKHSIKTGGLALFLATVFVFLSGASFSVTATLGLALALFVLFNLKHYVQRFAGMSLAHTGFAVLIIGIFLSGHLSQQRQVRVQPGNAVTLGPYQFFFTDTTGVQGPNYRGIRGTFDVMKGSKHITYLYPEKRIFTVRDMVMTKVDIHPGIFRDLYIALGEPLEGKYWSVRIYYKPFVRWIWTGGILMLIGGILAIAQRSTAKPEKIIK